MWNFEFKLVFISCSLHWMSMSLTLYIFLKFFRIIRCNLGWHKTLVKNLTKTLICICNSSGHTKWSLCVWHHLHTWHAFSPSTPTIPGTHYCPPFSDKEIDLKRLSDLPKIPQLCHRFESTVPSHLSNQAFMGGLLYLSTFSDQKIGCDPGRRHRQGQFNIKKEMSCTCNIGLVNYTVTKVSPSPL